MQPGWPCCPRPRRMLTQLSATTRPRLYSCSSSSILTRVLSSGRRLSAQFRSRSRERRFKAGWTTCPIFTKWSGSMSPRTCVDRKGWKAWSNSQKRDRENAVHWALSSSTRGIRPCTSGLSSSVPCSPHSTAPNRRPSRRVFRLSTESSLSTTACAWPTFIGRVCPMARPLTAVQANWAFFERNSRRRGGIGRYANSLLALPIPDGSLHRLGLIYRHLADTAYERGRSRTNPKEAGAVAEAVMEHASAQLRLAPEERLTLGVAAFSVAQMQAIQDQLEYRRRLDPSCEEFLAAHSHEPFFVKNLENVQGDERDVIFISVGYGKTEEGYVAMDFGPVNRDGGERRLNVLITRARIRCEVFTNLSADDIDLSRSKQRGVRALKTFLAYAETDRLDIPEQTDRDDDSPFEDEVYASLVAEGFEVHRQIGTAGFFVDLAIKDSDAPGRYILGIECDGATYHSARSARDRDRLRQQILEGLGWRIHRIWSTSWFRHPDRELKRVAEAIAQAKLAAKVTSPAREHTSSAVAATSVEREEATPVEAETRRIPLYGPSHPTINTRGLALHEVDSNRIADAAVTVIDAESPVHIDEVCRRLAEAFGHQRVGSRIREAVERACALAVTSRRVRKVGDFYWSVQMKALQVRDRSELPVTSRKFELVAPEEVAEAVAIVVGDFCGIEISEVPSVVVRLLGFGRCSADMDQQVRVVIKRMVRKGTLSLQGKMLVVAQTGE